MRRNRRFEQKRRTDTKDLELWKPKTKLGKLVLEGKIKTMHDALTSRLPLREPEIADMLLPNLEDEVVDINMVQRMTDSGRRVKFAITAVVGNCDGYVGIGREKGKEVGPTIKRAIANAKVNLIEIKRGCGSWECGCGKPHSLPFAITGKVGSVVVIFKPAPQGTSLAVGTVAKSIMRLAGVKDVWGFASGHTKTTVNYALASYDALKKNATLKVTPPQTERLHIVRGAVGVPITAGIKTAAEFVIDADKVEKVAEEPAKVAGEGAEPAAKSELLVAAEAPIPIMATEKVVKVLKKIGKEDD